MADAAETVEPERRRNGKSATAFRTISEVASELDVPPHVLRFWESKFSQVRPLKRGGGRRYYRPEDIDLLRAIRELLYTDGYTIKGVQKLLREGGIKALSQETAEADEAKPEPAPGRRGKKASQAGKTPPPKVVVVDPPPEKQAEAASSPADAETIKMLRGGLEEVLGELEALKASLSKVLG